jgi:hypothetical protein
MKVKSTHQNAIDLYESLLVMELALLRIEETAIVEMAPQLRGLLTILKRAVRLADNLVGDIGDGIE